MSAAAVWWRGARPRTLGAGLVPVALGTAAAGEVIWWRFIAALLVGGGLQVGVNYANDYFDGVRGVVAIRVAGVLKDLAADVQAGETAEPVTLDADPIRYYQTHPIKGQLSLDLRVTEYKPSASGSWGAVARITRKL